MQNLASITALSAMVFTTMACNPQKDTIARVTVLNASNAPVVGATVHLFDGNNGERIDVESTTNGSGMALFNFNEYYDRGTAGLAVLDVEISRDSVTENFGVIEVKIEDITEESYIFDP